MNKITKAKYIIGIDEAGRGPIAGPVSVGAFVFINNSIKKDFSDARDSKKLTEKKREEIFERILKYHKNGDIKFAVFMSSSSVIDKKGIVFAIKSALSKCLEKINLKPEEVEVLLDGSLKAPEKYLKQKTIIKGDDKVREISLASICAKVVRDREMVKFSKKYPKYNLDIHKGYGTKAHYESISKNGLSEIHRRSFLKRFS